jgi:hypothetical protein
MTGLSSGLLTTSKRQESTMSSTGAVSQPGGAPTEAKSDLFILHAQADRAWVEGYLKPSLGLDRNRVITPSEFDPTGTVPGEFGRAVNSSRFTMLVLSPAFLADEWARFGEQLVTFASVEAGQVRLLAIDRHACDLPLSLRFRVRLDFTKQDHWDKEISRLRAVLDQPAPTIAPITCPYPGMVPFRKEDARFFHGRDAEIQNLLTLVRQHHFLAVIGSSGSGKSSLITAGLLPRLDDARSFPRGTWRVLSLRPGTTPVEELARILGGPPDDSAAAVARSLAADPPAQRLLLFVDQFEELFSQVKAATTRESFINHLKALRADPRCTVILTMRADFYGDLMNSPLWPIDRSQLVEVAALRGGPLRQAIVKPAEAVGVYLEDGLVERLLADAADEPGSLPMLQEALVLLWGTMSGRLLTRASYDALGHDGRSGLAVAMATKADATLAALPPEQQRVARRIFLRLVQFGEGRPDTRRQLGVDDLRAESDDPGAFNDLLQHLIANRLLTPSADEVRGLRVDIAHEMLIIGWPASRDWVESRREAEKTRRRLVDKAQEWVRLGRGESGLLDPAELAEADAWLFSPDAAELGVDSDVQALAVASHRAIDLRRIRKRMWTRVAIGGLTAALIVISGFAYFAHRARVDAEISEAKAVSAREAAQITAAEGLFRPLVREPGDLNEREVEALQQLGGLKPDQEGVRIKFLEHALSDASRSSRLANRMPVAIQAMIGLDPGRRAQVLRILQDRLADQKAPVALQVSVADAVTELDSSDPSTNEASLRILLQAFAIGEKTLDKGRLAADIANRLVKVMEALPADQQGRVANSVADAMAKQSDAFARQALAAGLAGVAKALPPQRAAILLDPPARTLADVLARETDPSARAPLAAGLAELAKALPPERGVIVLDAPARTLADALAGKTDPYARLALAAALAEVAKALPPERAAILLDPPARTLADAIASENDDLARHPLVASLMALAKALPPERAAILLAKQTNFYALEVVLGLTEVARALPPERAAILLADALAKHARTPFQQPLAAGLAEVAKALPPERAAMLLADALVKETDAFTRQIFAAGLAGVAKALPPGRAAILLDPPACTLADALAKEANPFARQSLAASLAGLAKSLPLGRTAILLDPPARTLADALAKQTDPSARQALAAGLAEVAKALPPERTAILLDPPVRTLADALAGEANPYARQALAEGLAGLAKALPPERTASLLDAPAGTLADALAREISALARPPLVAGLTGLAKALPPERAAILLTDALAKQTTDPPARQALAAGLAEVAKALPPERAAILLADALAKQTDALARFNLAGGLAEVAKAVPPERAAILLDPPARTLADALAKQTPPTLTDVFAKQTDAEARRALAAGLAGLAKALSPEQAENLLADALAREADAFARQALAAGLAGLAKALPPERAANVLADALARETDRSARQALAAGLAGLEKALPPERIEALLIDSKGRFLDLSDQLLPAIRELAGRDPLEHQVEWLKRPLCYGETRQAILSQIKTPDGATFRSHWELVAWLQKNRPAIDLTAPPIDPDRSSQR